jgi:molecular chaperone DnaK
MAYSIEKTLNDNRDKVGEAEAKSIEEAIAEVRKAAEGDDVDAIKAAMEKLTKQSHKLAEELYKQQASEGAEPEGASTPGGDQGDVVDAEVVNEDAKAGDEKKGDTD